MPEPTDEPRRLPGGQQRTSEQVGIALNVLGSEPDPLEVLDGVTCGVDLGEHVDRCTIDRPRHRSDRTALGRLGRTDEGEGHAAESPLVSTIVIAVASLVPDVHMNGEGCVSTASDSTFGVSPS